MDPLVHTVVIAPPPPEEILVTPRSDPPPAETATPSGCGHEIRLRVGRVSLSHETVQRALLDVHEPLKAALCDCMRSRDGIVAITPSRGAIDVSGVGEEEMECMRARLVAPAFIPWTFQPDCPTCGVPIGIFPPAPPPPPPPDGTLFAHLRFD
jgi:hypothetical protein